MKSERETAGADRIKFRFPPINELVIGIHFEPILELKSQHIGMFWDSVREMFPICEQQAPHVIPAEGMTGAPSFPPLAPGEIFPLQRFWFRSNEHPLLIQVQRDAFWLNWRRASDGEYPHYEIVEESFWREFTNYKDFVQSIGGTLEVVSRRELTYVNLISHNAFSSGPGEFAKVIPAVTGFTEMQTGNRKFVGCNASVTYQLNDDLVIDAAVKTGKRLDTNEPALVLELKAYGIPNNPSLEATKEWFKDAHDGTYRLFLDLTDKEVQQQLWKPI
jgi:uncharacterized protein (TIGR04255 family)